MEGKMSPADKAREIAATLNASTFSDNASFVAKCESLIAAALLQAVSAEREACASHLAAKAEKLAKDAYKWSSPNHEILMTKGQAFAEAEALIRARGENNEA
jgi:hypothetical protein